MKHLFLIALGGSFGAVCRYSLTALLNYYHLASFWGTLAVNLIGCFLVGFLFPLISGNELLKLIFIIGFLGSFTTFSTYSLDNLELIRSGQVKTMLVYLLASNVLGILFAFLGYWLHTFVKS